MKECFTERVAKERHTKHALFHLKHYQEQAAKGKITLKAKPTHVLTPLFCQKPQKLGAISASVYLYVHI